MLKRCPALFCAALLLASAPASALAQTRRAAASERNLSAAAPEKKPVLKTLVAVVVGVSVWAIANPGDDTPPGCINDPSNTLCT